MFSDLSLSELQDLRTKLRDALVKLVAGQLVSEIKYGEMSRRFAPTTPDACRKFLAEVAAEIERRNSGRRGPLYVLGT